MNYVVHVFPTKERRKFATFKAAFAWFKAMFRTNRGVALWHGNSVDGWTRVYATEGYPLHLSRPWCQG